MTARRRVFLIMGILLIAAICFYIFTVPQSQDLVLIGRVDANEVIVSSRIPGMVQTLTVEEGQKVSAGQVVATIQSNNLDAAQAAAAATAAGAGYKLRSARATQRQTAGQTASQVTGAQAQLRVAQASLDQAQAQYEHQLDDTRRTEALAKQGVMSSQSRDEAVTSLNAAKAAADGARQNVSAAQAALKVAEANTALAQAAEQNAAASQADVANARALLDQAKIQVDYAQVASPVTGVVDVRAARQGEVVAAGTPIVTVVDLSQTWVYAPLPETQASAVQLGDRLRVEMLSGATTDGKVIAKLAEADFATQRDVSRNKRDIKTVQLKLLIDNPGMRYVPGMTAKVYVPKDRLAKQ